MDQDRGLSKEDAPPLGLISIPDGTFEHDRTLAQGYQAFSGELLHLSLLGIAAAGFLVTTAFTSGSDARTTVAAVVITPGARVLMIASIIALGVSAGAALLHRFFAADGLAFHLRSLRLDVRKAAGDGEKSSAEKRGRQLRFLSAYIAIWVSGMSLWIGALCLGGAFALVI